ncbi:hypothetical protein GKO32_07595 [Amycolatopsis sp. RM579]|uniref:Uncharacterized protein n=1 Tax=Amycolatopsis pithecellobii TaxID=664692 RepID=A0A6N7YY70_9PSEU|nr:hypothetical protein [Amycolatopsis pithecellobii]MTD53843.1 hypothetical protein [Amycolatopsis pithecellobii]
MARVAEPAQVDDEDPVVGGQQRDQGAEGPQVSGQPCTSRIGGPQAPAAT